MKKQFYCFDRYNQRTKSTVRGMLKNSSTERFTESMTENTSNNSLDNRSRLKNMLRSHLVVSEIMSRQSEPEANVDIILKTIDIAMEDETKI